MPKTLKDLAMEKEKEKFHRRKTYNLIRVRNPKKVTKIKYQQYYGKRKK
jgi:hypothetical protein